MQIDKTLENGKLSLSLAGRLDTTTAPDLEAEMVLDGVSEIAFDLSRLEYISSAGLRILLSAQKAMTAAGGKMTVANPNETVSGVFGITGLDSIFTIVRTDAVP
jgi:anti-sigma B factor antagonist